MLGTISNKKAQMKMWQDPVTENPQVGDIEIWEFYNFTMDAHPIHIHEVAFQVVNRQAVQVDPSTQQLGGLIGVPIAPQPWETGFKDTVTVYPGQVTRVKAQFNTPGLFVWHCHIVEHEDNEMMRPYYIGPIPKDLPKPM
jgi:spore coat protein A, manganese oxidase